MLGPAGRTIRPRPRKEVEDDAEPRPQGQHDERHADDRGIDAGYLCEAAGRSGQYAIVGAAPERETGDPLSELPAAGFRRS